MIDKSNVCILGLINMNISLQKKKNPKKTKHLFLPFVIGEEEQSNSYSGTPDYE